MREAGPADPLRVAERREIGYLHRMKWTNRNVGEIHGDGQAESADGQELVTIVRSKKRLPGPPPGWNPDQVSSTAGALADSWTSDDDRILEEIYQDRKRETRRGVPG